MYTTTTYGASGHKVMPHKRTHELLELFVVTHWLEQQVDRDKNFKVNLEQGYQRREESATLHFA